MQEPKTTGSYYSISDAGRNHSSRYAEILGEKQVDKGKRYFTIQFLAISFLVHVATAV